ncbi:MAG TPA: long-chain fatty acid--CoA ligase [Polyangia bacterium]|jgi:Long-chain acyl-CoA synthetases (AMP-forming)|nr:long-chain fatty acid--CoA ligase [Polyangia bacterium]
MAAGKVKTPEGKSALSARTAGDIWRSRVTGASDSIAFRFREGDDWRGVTWQQADVAAHEIAGGLAGMGIGVGECVCILAQTRLEWVLCDVALVMAGAVSVPIYPSSTPEQCAYIVKDSGARTVIAEDATQLDKLVPLLAQIPKLRLVFFDGDSNLAGGDADGRKVPRLADVLAAVEKAGGVTPRSLAALRRAGQAWLAGQAAELDRRTAEVGPDHVFTIVYTSGTTGRPKGVVLTHRNMVESFASALRAFDLRDTDVQYVFLPLAHVLGRELEWAPILAGCAFAFSAGQSRIKFDLVDVRPTFMAGVPRVFEKLHAALATAAGQGSWLKRAIVRWAFSVGARYAAGLRRGERSTFGLRIERALADRLVLSKLRALLGFDRCRFVISGGAPLAAEIAEFFHGLGLLVLEGYGLTETTAAAFVNRWNCYRFGTVGPAIDVIQSRIADDGEILMRGPSVFTRYHNNSAATAEAMDSEGWFHSGDIGHIEDGFLSIVDRKKDIIVTAGGKNVAPQMIETALQAHCPLISQVVVFGDNRPHCVAIVTPSEFAARQFGGGSLPRAALEPELRAAVEDAVAAINRTLASYETIKNFAILPGDFSEATGELTPSLKVKREVVKSRYGHIVDALYKKAS